MSVGVKSGKQKMWRKEDSYSTKIKKANIRKKIIIIYHREEEKSAEFKKSILKRLDIMAWVWNYLNAVQISNDKALITIWRKRNELLMKLASLKRVKHWLGIKNE